MLADNAFLIIVQLEPTELYQVNQYKEIRGRESVSTYLLSSQRSVPDGLHFFKLVDFVPGSTDCFVRDPSSNQRRNTILINTTMTAQGTKTYEIVESFDDKLAETPLESKMAVLGSAETLQLLSNSGTATSAPSCNEYDSEEDLSPFSTVDSLMLSNAVQRSLNPENSQRAATTNSSTDSSEETTTKENPLRIIERCPIFIPAPSAVFVRGNALATPRPFKINGHVEIYVDPITCIIFGLRFVLKP